MMNAKTVESRLRRRLAAEGLALRKSRRRNWHPDEQQGYTIIDPNTGFPVAGFKWNFELEDVARWLEN